MVHYTYDIIIPIYNGYNFLEPLFTSLMNGTTISHRMIIINDASSDLQVKTFLNNIYHYQNRYCKEIIIHNNEKNLGFVRSVNFAYTFVQNNFVILNTDTEVPDGWLTRLMSPMLRDNTIASITPLTNSGTICSFPCWLEDNSLAFELTLQQIDDVLKKMDDQELIKVPTGVGFCMAINKKVVEIIGFLDEKTFGRGYGEENDWCMRAKKSGYKNVIIKNLFVFHKHGGSFGMDKAQLIEKNAKKLLKKHPSYNKEVARLIKLNPMNRFYPVASIKMFATYKPAVIFCHFWGGGSDHFIHEHLLSDTNNPYQILIRGSGVKSHNNIEFIHNQKCIFKITIQNIVEILDILSVTDIDQYYLNHVITLDNLPNSFELLTKFFVDNQIKPIYYLHDYFFICPSFNLINDKGKYCELPTDKQICNSCLKNNKKFIPVSLQSDLIIEDWRNSTFNLLQQCSVIYVFSNSSIKLLNKIFSTDIWNKVKIYHLRLNKPAKIILKPDFSENKVITIGLLGHVQFTKGLKIMQQLANLIAELSLPFKISIVGTSGEPIVNAKTFGVYNKNDISQICQSEKIDLFIVPSICPETYCYTADEIIAMGYPVISFDIGGHGERISQYQHGLVISRINALDLLNGLIQFVQQYGFDFEKNRELKMEYNSYFLLMTELQQMKHTLNILFNSRSWKITKPLRYVMNIVKKVI